MFKIGAFAVLLVIIVNQHITNAYEVSCKTDREKWNDFFVGCEKTCENLPCNHISFVVKYCSCKIGYVRANITDGNYSCILPQECPGGSDEIEYEATDDAILIMYVVFIIIAFVVIFACLSYKILMYK